MSVPMIVRPHSRAFVCGGDPLQLLRANESSRLVKPLGARRQPRVVATFSGILCLDEVHQGDLALLLAVDPVAPDGDRLVGFKLLSNTEEIEMIQSSYTAGWLALTECTRVCSSHTCHKRSAESISRAAALGDTWRLSTK
jgi:hypothetical protein